MRNITTDFGVVHAMGRLNRKRIRGNMVADPKRLRAAGRSCGIALGLGFASIAASQTGSNLIATIAKHRAAFPAMTARVKEIVSVQGTPPTLPPNSASWGDRNGERTFDSAYKSGARYFASDSIMGAVSPGVPVISEKQILKDGKSFLDMPNQHQGKFGTARFDHETPIVAGYFLENMPVDEMLNQARDLSVTSDPATSYIQAKFGNGHANMTLQIDPNREYQIVHAEESNGANETLSIDIADFEILDKVHVPSRMITRSSRGVTKTFEVQDLKPGASDSLFQPSWKEGTRVSESETSNVYLVHNGKLVLDPLFSRSAAQQKSTYAVVFMVSTVLLILLAARFIWKRSKAGRSSLQM